MRGDLGEKGMPSYMSLEVCRATEGVFHGADHIPGLNSAAATLVDEE